MSNGYWAERIAKAQTAITNKSIRQTEAQLKKYYTQAMKKTLDNFEKTYNKVLSSIDEGKEATPADLYKLDTYWQLQGQLRAELQKLGDKQITLLSKNFELHFFEIYYSFGIPGEQAFNTLDVAGATQLINSVWVADGKTYSQRIWNNTERLLETLNDEMLHCVITGKKTSELKKVLQERFNISYRRADTLVRTEMAHIQTQAAQARYKDYGIEYVEVLVDEDARTCELCKEIAGKQFPINAVPPLPLHPNERCCLIPVV